MIISKEQITFVLRTLPNIYEKMIHMRPYSFMKLLIMTQYTFHKYYCTINAVTIFTYDTSLVTVFLDLLKAFDSTSGGILTIPFIIAYLMLLWTSSGAVFQREYNI